MGKNNKMYQCFKQLMEGYKLGTKEGDVMVTRGTVNWLSYDPENPFEPGSQEHNHFDRMQQFYAAWKRNETGSRHSKRQLVAEAIELCKCNPKNPYKFNKQEDEDDKKKAKELELARLKADQEREAKEIERRASLIVEEEQRRQAVAEAKAKATKELERKKAEEKTEQNRQATLVQKAVDEKLSKINAAKKELQTEKTVVLGVVPEEMLKEESVEEVSVKNHKLFSLFKKKE